MYLCSSDIKSLPLSLCSPNQAVHTNYLPKTFEAFPFFSFLISRD